MKTLILVAILLLAFGCLQNNITNGDLVKKQSGSNETKDNTDEIKIQETTVGETCNKRIGVGNIFKDNDGVLRATVSILGEKTSRVAKGETLNSGAVTILVKDIVEKPSKGSMPGGSQSYIVLECMDNSKPYAAPEGIPASEINKPNLPDEGELTTIKGKAEETKAGIYVEGVLVEFDNASKYAGKMVEVTGYLKTGIGSGGLDKETGLATQGYGGEYQYMTKIKEIKIVKE